MQATIECRLTLKHVRYVVITYSQMHRAVKYSQHNSIICPVWLSVRLRTKCLWVRDPLLSLKLQISRLIRARSSLTFLQL